MASSSFRESINSLGWSRRANTDYPVTTAPQQSGFFTKLQSLNPFGGDRGYVRLPTTESQVPPPPTRQDEEGWFTLSRWDRLMIFAACNLGALACFSICFFLFPVISLGKPRKLVVLWTLGSILFLSSFAAVMGPMAYFQHLASGPRLPFTAAYFGSLTLTLYFSIGLQSTILTFLAGIIQLASLVWYLVSYFPMGSSALRMVGNFGASQAANWISG
ncbi:hypothetical protein VTJ83DRAFT_2037 [Remersonia thermophila]|uniref:Protein transport protein SFT2 n=1 Tax=Remersonia thermophila TaxID=72144 RepID=A0ABR4DHM0_9PEZI